jgi:hypothetical protein
MGNYRRVGFMLAIMLAVISMTACEYWPPALQAQIEQLQLELQTTAVERTKLQAQLLETTKVKEELQARLEELTRSNHELTTRLSGLEHALAVERAKKASLVKDAKPTPKPVAKSARKGQSKKKTAKASSHNRKGT